MVSVSNDNNVFTYQQILDGISYGIIATDQTGLITYANEQAANILQVSEKKIVNTRISGILPSTGFLLKKCFDSGNPLFGHHISDLDHTLLFNITPVYHEQQLCGSVCTFQTLQQFEDDAQKLDSFRQLKMQFEAIFKSSSDGMWVIDNKGIVLNLNRASEELYEVKAKEIIGKRVSELLKNGILDSATAPEILKTKKKVSTLSFLASRKKDILTTGTPILDEQGEISLIIANERVMTQLNAIKEELEQTRLVKEKFKEELEHLNLLRSGTEKFIAESNEMQQLLKTALKLATLGVSDILILGESGTGKGHLARFIHENSIRKNNPFIQINCAALPENLLEAELFGYEKGAFTGAKEQGKAGLFELADNGTLFLDEIGELPLSVQAKLLKYLDDHEIIRLGGTTSKQIDCTIVAATNRSYESLSKKRLLREDLLFRLNTFTLRIPPLRNRPEDLFALITHYLQTYNTAYGQHKRVSSKGYEALQSYSFPGNIRELKNIIKSAVVMNEKNSIDEFALPAMAERTIHSSHNLDGRDALFSQSLQEAREAREKDILKYCIKRFKSTRAIAFHLKVSHSTIVRKLKKYGLSTVH